MKNRRMKAEYQASSIFFALMLTISKKKKMNAINPFVHISDRKNLEKAISITRITMNTIIGSTAQCIFYTL